MGLFGGKKSPEEEVAEIERLAVTGFGVWGIHGTLVHDPDDRLNSRIVTASGAQYGMANLIFKCLAEPERAWKRVISEHAASLGSLANAAAPTTDLDDPATHGMLRARLVPSMLSGQLDLGYAPTFAPGILEALCLDLPQTVSTLSGEVLAGRTDLDALRAAGRANLERETIDEKGELAPGLRFVAGGSLFVASQLLNPAFVAREIGPGPRGFVFAIPDRHLILFHVMLGPESVAVIQQIVGMTVQHVATERPGGVLSPEVYYRDPSGGVQQITMIGDDGAIGVRVEGPFLEAVNA